MKRTLGIGNALTDILINLDDDNMIREFELEKGSMTLVDPRFQKRLSEATAGLPHTLSLGGSSGNTIRALAKLGAPAGFIGKVGDDGTGKFFGSALGNLGIEPHISTGTNPSGRCISLVSDDGERTMCTYLGAALELTGAELDPASFRGYDYFYIEGYLVQNHDLIEQAVRIAKECGLTVVLDLASFNVVKENLEFLRMLLGKYVDIVFANEEEAEAISGIPEPTEALDYLSELCRMAIVKVGIKGAYIKYEGEVTHVGILKAATRIDTTGAGDFYAGGFLYGLSNGMDLRQCGTIGAITAGKVIEVVGTTFAEDVWDEIRALVREVALEKYLF